MVVKVLIGQEGFAHETVALDKAIANELGDQAGSLRGVEVVMQFRQYPVIGAGTTFKAQANTQARGQAIDSGGLDEDFQSIASTTNLRQAVASHPLASVNQASDSAQGCVQSAGVIAMAVKDEVFIA